jgi:hypothetical protein
MTAAVGSMSKAREVLRVALADCDSFRSWVGASGEDAQDQARARIHDDALPEPEDGGPELTLAELRKHRPYAIVATATFGRDHVSTSDGYDYGADGGLSLQLEQDVPEAIKNNPAEIARRFENLIGSVIDDLCALSGTSDAESYLAFESIKMPEPWSRTHPDDHPTEGDAVRAELLIEWSGI